MIKTYEILKEELKNYKNPKTKIQRMVKNKEIFPIVKGLYETNELVDPFYLANLICAPSYIYIIWNCIIILWFNFRDSLYDKKRHI